MKLLPSIQAVLGKFNIPLANILSVTTDNGSNMLKLVRWLNMGSPEDFVDHDDESYDEEESCETQELEREISESNESEVNA